MMSREGVFKDVGKFAGVKWKRKEKPDEIDASYPQSKALSIEWNSLPQNQINKYEQSKINGYYM